MHRPEDKKIVYFFPHFHYDVVWKFTRVDYYYINQRLLRHVVVLCSLFPEFKFGVEDAYQFMEVERKDPELFKRLLQEVERGRVIVVDGQYLMADSFLPGGEVFVRGVLRGKRYIKRRLGIDVKVGWIVDSFGLNAQTPQIYVDAGYRWLVFGRGRERKPKRADFKWRGLDGTEILAHYLSSKHSYHVGLFAEHLKDNIEELERYSATRHILMPCGIGSSPFPEWVLKTIEDFNKVNPEYEVRIATPEEYFKAIEEEDVEFATEEGEMYSGERIFDGVWSTRMWVKLGYFKVRELLLTLERFAVVAWLLGKPYPEREINEAWDDVLFLAFHDVVTGTSIDEVFKEVAEVIERLRDRLTTLLYDVLSFLAYKLGSISDSITVFNPNSFEVVGYVEHEERFNPEEEVEGVEVEGAPFEIIEEERDAKGSLRRVKLGLLATAPPLGFHQYRLRRGGRRGEEVRRVSGRTFIENDRFRIEVDPVTGVLSIYHRELGAVRCRLELEHEVGSLYSHRDITLPIAGLVAAEGERASNKPLFNVEEVKVLEGPISKRLIVKERLYGSFWPYRLRDHYGVELYRHELMEIEKELRLVDGLPWIEAYVRLKNNFSHVRVRWCFYLDFKGSYVAGTAFGAIERRMEDKEYPMEEWLDYSNDEKGLAVFTRGIWGHQVSEGKVGLTLLRSVDLLSYGDKGPIIPVPGALEVGREYRFEFAFTLHRGGWRDVKAWRLARSYANSLIPVKVEKVAGEHARASFLSLPDGVVLTGLKRSEDGRHVVVRFYEAAGRGGEATLHFFKQPRGALLSNITEEREEPSSLTFKLRPFQIVTVKLEV